MEVPIADTLTHLARADEERRQRGEQRRTALLAVLPLAREVLLRHGAERVWAFGSIVSGGASERSDLDLATRGLPSGAYFAALGELFAALPCTVDLVRLEEAPISLRERVESEGRLL